MGKQGKSCLGIKLRIVAYLTSFLWVYEYDLQVNCIGVLDSVLGAEVRLGVEEFDAGRLDMHPCDKKDRPLAIISPTGKWEGEDDGGLGSPHIRCSPKWHKSEESTSLPDSTASLDLTISSDSLGSGDSITSGETTTIKESDSSSEEK